MTRTSFSIEEGDLFELLACPGPNLFKCCVLWIRVEEFDLLLDRCTQTGLNHQERRKAESALATLVTLWLAGRVTLIVRPRRTS